MKCRAGIGTGRLLLRFRQDDYDEIRRRCPAPIGVRSWFLIERDGGISMERSRYGVSPIRNRGTPDQVELHADVNTIVRCHIHEADVEFPRRGQVFVRLPPLHLRPWIRDVRSALKVIPIDKWRWHLVQELNARTRSATGAGVDMPSDLPDWVAEMLTQSEMAAVLSNQEI